MGTHSPSRAMSEITEKDGGKEHPLGFSNHCPFIPQTSLPLFIWQYSLQCCIYNVHSA